MNIAKKRFLHQVQRRRENKNLKGRRPGLLIYFVLILGEKISSFNEIPWIVQEGKPDQSLALRPDPLAEQCLALCHPPSRRDSSGSCHCCTLRALAQAPGDRTNQPLQQRPLTVLFRSIMGSRSTVALPVRSVEPRIQQWHGDAGKIGFAQLGCPHEGKGWAAGHTSALQARGSQPSAES